MSSLVDVANFNADASCLSSKSWIASLDGGKNSQLHKWLEFYVALKKKITIGFTGGTIADILALNPCSLDLINENPKTFEILLRPFAHDISILRTPEAFLLNFSWGKTIIQNEFRNVAEFYLPPEFMLTNEQVFLLSQEKIDGLFLNPERFDIETRKRIPRTPYRVKGIHNSLVNCIPVSGMLTNLYLHSIHNFDSQMWNKAILDQCGVIYSWRDAESSFLLPDGLQREKFWLEEEEDKIERVHLKEIQNTFIENSELPEQNFHSYPMHSFHAWMKEFRMLGFLKRVENIENRLGQLNYQQKMLWLQTICSDILSSIEKTSPKIKLKKQSYQDTTTEHIIYRSERAFEGEEYLNMLEESMKVTYDVRSRLCHQPHQIKLRNRLDYLPKIEDAK